MRHTAASFLHGAFWGGLLIGLASMAFLPTVVRTRWLPEYHVIDRVVTAPPTASVFRVDTPLVPPFWRQRNGTAFLVDRGAAGVGLLTAWHVVDEVVGPVSVVAEDGTACSALFERIDQSDLAWARVPGLPASWKPLGVSEARVGGLAAAWGFAEGGRRLSMAAGRVLFEQTDLPVPGLFAPDGKYLGLDTVITDGYSGGPVLDESGYVVAVSVVSSSRSSVSAFAVAMPAPAD